MRPAAEMHYCCRTSDKRKGIHEVSALKMAENSDLCVADTTVLRGQFSALCGVKLGEREESKGVE